MLCIGKQKNTLHDSMLYLALEKITKNMKPLSLLGCCESIYNKQSSVLCDAEI